MDTFSFMFNLSPAAMEIVANMRIITPALIIPTPSDTTCASNSFILNQS